VAAQVLVRMGFDLNRVRREVLKLLGSESGAVQLAGAAGETWPGAGEVRTARGGASRDFLLAEVRNALASISERLTAIERHLGVRARPADYGDSADDLPHGTPLDQPDDPPGDVTASGQ